MVMFVSVLESNFRFMGDQLQVTSFIMQGPIQNGRADIVEFNEVVVRANAIKNK